MKRTARVDWMVRNTSRMVKWVYMINKSTAIGGGMSLTSYKLNPGKSDQYI